MKRSYIAAVSLIGLEGYAVQMDGDAKVSPATDGTTGEQDIVGIIAPYTGCDAGQSTTIVSPGDECCTYGVAGNVLTPGVHRLLTVDGIGRLVPAGAGSTAIAEWVGQANGAAQVNDLIEVCACRVIIPAAV